MKYLKIDDNKGYFLRTKDSNSEWIEIDKVNKDDLLQLLNTAIEDGFDMDVYAEAVLANKAHQIIYKSIYEKFLGLTAMKSKFKDESDSLYKEAIEKYSVGNGIE